MAITPKEFTMSVQRLFNNGDSVVYPGHGVGTVVGMRSERIHDAITEYLVVGFPSGMTLRIPVANIKKSGLRSVASRRSIQEVFNILSEAAVRKKTMWRHRALEYGAKIKSGDPKAIAEIVRDLHRAPGDAEASFSEKSIYQQAWDHLIPEIAAVNRIDLESAAQKVVALLEAA
jgi:CarD family transcriptional regulator